MGNTCSDSENDGEIDARTNLETERVITSPQSFRTENLTDILIYGQEKERAQKTPDVFLDQECIICYDGISVRDAYWLPCSHVFHGKCICRWFDWTDQRKDHANTQKKTIRRCPICSHGIM